MTASLVATLGSAPQIISLGAQALIASGAQLSSIHVVCTTATMESAVRLHDYLRGVYPDTDVHLVKGPVDDVLTDAEFARYADALYSVLRALLVSGNTLHLLLAGGRKPMALIAMNMAQLLLGPNDHVWYLHSSEELRQSGRMVAGAGDRVQLIDLPHSSWAWIPPRYSSIIDAETPVAARSRLERQREEHLQQFVDDILTVSERQLALLLAAEVLTTTDLARRLHKSPKTITNQLNSVYSKMESYFGISSSQGLKREFLRQHMAQYLLKNPDSFGN